MLNLLLIIYLIYITAKISLEILEINFIKAEAQKPAVILDDSKYQQAANIKIANLKFEIINIFYQGAIFLAWAIFGLRALKNALLNVNIGADIIFIMSFLIINLLLSLPFEIYEKFIKDKKHGFSNITPKIFIIDSIKSLLLTLIFGSLFVWLIIVCIDFLGSFWWFWAFCLSFLIILIINLIYPTIIAPLFNKVTPLDDGELKGAIEELLKKCGFKSSGIFIMDASKRDNRLNAYFGGLGATKRVVLFDTLVKKLNQSEIIAVLGHELGHFKHKDIFKMIALSALMLFLLFLIFANLSSGVYSALGLDKNSAGIIVFMLLFSPIFSFVFSPVISYFSRKNEFGADKFGSEIGETENMISALKKLGAQNRAFPKSHPLYSAIYHSHPSLFERINELENDAK